MMLADLTAKPSDPNMLASVHHFWNAPALNALTLPGLEHLSRVEKANLLTHLIWAAQSWSVIDAEQADSVLATTLSSSSDENHLVTHLLNAIASLAGESTAQWLEGRPTGFDLKRVHVLWDVRKLGALPEIAKSWSSLGRYAVKYAEAGYEDLRQAANIAKPAWKLLLYPWEASATLRKKAIGEFSTMLERGATMPLADWKLLATHPVHGEIVTNLVLAAEGGLFFLPPEWPAVGSIGIAHPSMLTEQQIAEWKTRVPKSPFDQWKASKHLALKLDPVGLTAQPSDLLLHLEGCGWIRGRASREDWLIRTHSKTFPDLGVTAEVEYDDGVPTRFGGRWKQQTIRACRFFRQSHGLEIATSEVHPIALASVMADLAPLQKS